MYSNSLIAELKKVVGWEDYWDLSEIPSLGSPLNDSESGQYYNETVGAIRLDYISSLLPSNRTLSEFLDTIETKAIQEVLNQIQQKRKLRNVGKEIVSSDVVFGNGEKVTILTNESRFCGVMFELMPNMGLTAVLNKVGFYLTASVTNLDLYLFHSSQEQVVSKYQFTTTSNNSFSWQEIRAKLNYDISSSGITEGTWFFGYYQDDLAAQATQAIQYNSMNWMHGYCNQCGSESNYWDAQYKSIRTRLFMTGFYVPGPSLPVDKNELFDPNVAVKTNNNNWGLNFNITMVCDLTQFWIDNRETFAYALRLAVSMKCLEMMKYSSQINNVEEALKVMIIRDLEGATDTKNPPLNQRLADEIESLMLDEGNLNKDCFPCARKPKTKYGGIGK